MKSASAAKTSDRARKALVRAVAGRRSAKQDDILSDPLYLQNLFAANVRLIRNARDITQEELADRASLDRTYISSVERRLRNVSIQNIQRLAVALQVDPRELLDPALERDPRYQK